MRMCLSFTVIQRLKPYFFIGNIDHENLNDFYSNSKANALLFIGNSNHENLHDFYSNSKLMPYFLLEIVIMRICLICTVIKRL